MEKLTANAQADWQAASAGASTALSAHFVNNVLAAAASYIDEDPDRARDVLAELGQFLSYGLRSAQTPVTVAQELEHTATYLRLQQARFPGRIDVRPLADPDVGRTLTAGAVRVPVAAALERRLRSVSGPCILDLHLAGDDLELELRGPQDLVGETVAIALGPTPVEVPS